MFLWGSVHLEILSTEITKPTGSSGNPNIMRHQLGLFQHHFSQLSPSPRVVTSSHDLIMQGIGVIVTQQRLHDDELLVIRTAIKTNLVDKWL